MDERHTEADWPRWLEWVAPKFYLFARQQARSDADAEDLVQEAIVEAAQRCPGRIPPPALVFAIIRRRAIDLARSQDRRAGREMRALAHRGDSWFEPSVEQRDSARYLQIAMSSLPEMYREVITLKVWGELTFAQIGEALGIPPNTAASRYRYGLVELRKLTKEVLV